MSGFLALMAVSCAHDEPTSGHLKPMPRQIRASSAVNPALIQPGESLEVFVMEDPSFNGSYKVRERGDIIIPKLGRVQVAGLTAEAAQLKIQQQLQLSQLKVATVIADRVGGGNTTPFEEVPKLLVFVTGKVNKPGQHMMAVSNGDTVYAYEAVLIAGGVTQFGDEKNSYILRRGNAGSKIRIPFDIRAIRQGRADDIPLVAGDMICIPERRFAL